MRGKVVVLCICKVPTCCLFSPTVVPLTQEEKNQAWVEAHCPAPPAGSEFDMICEIMLKKLNSSTNSSPSTHNYIRHLAMKLITFKKTLAYSDAKDRPHVTYKFKTQRRQVVYTTPNMLSNQKWFDLKHDELGAFSFLSFRKQAGSWGFFNILAPPYVFTHQTRPPTEHNQFWKQTLGVCFSTIRFTPDGLVYNGEYDTNSKVRIYLGVQDSFDMTVKKTRNETEMMQCMASFIWIDKEEPEEHRVINKQLRKALVKALRVHSMYVWRW